MITAETEGTANSPDQENLQVVFLRKELALKTTQLDEAERVAQSLTTQLQAHVEQIAYYKEHASTQQKLIKELETSREQLAMQIQVGNLLDFAVPEIKNLRGTIEERTNYIYSLEAERDNLQNMVIQKDKQLQEVGRFQQELVSQNQTLVELEAGLEAEKNQLQAGLVSQGQTLLRLEAEKNQLLEIIEQQEAELKKLDPEGLGVAGSETIKNLQTQLDHKDHKIEQLQTQLVRQQLMLSSRDEYVDSLEKANQHLEKEKALLAQTLARFEGDLRSLQATLTVRASKAVGKLTRLFKS